MHVVEFHSVCYFWSKSEVSTTTTAKVSQIVLLYYQLIKISKKILAQPPLNSIMPISVENPKSLQPLQAKLAESSFWATS